MKPAEAGVVLAHSFLGANRSRASARRAFAEGDSMKEKGNCPYLTYGRNKPNGDRVRKGKRMFDTIKDEVLRPLLSRIGTGAGSALVALGMTEQSANNVVIGAIALSMFGLDLVINHFQRKRDNR